MSRPPLPLYWRLLRLRHVRPGPAMRVLLVEGLLLVGLLLILGGFANGWCLLVLPGTAAAVTKAHDLLVGALARSAA